MKNFERFDSPTKAYLAWASEEYNIVPDDDYELEDDIEEDQADYPLVREFLDWLWEEARNGEKEKEKE